MSRKTPIEADIKLKIVEIEALQHAVNNLKAQAAKAASGAGKKAVAS